MPALSAAARHHRARIAALSRDRAPDDPELVAEKQALAVERLAQHAERVVALWPNPPEEQLRRVAAILLTTTSGATPPDARKAAADRAIAELDGGGDHAA